VTVADRLALYAGTFDPVTHGHLDILRRALALFDRVTVAVAAGGKQTLFTLDERLALVRVCTADLERVVVMPLPGLLVDEVSRSGAVAVVRGIRSLGDYHHEWSMEAMNRALSPECETVFLLARQELAMLSSSLVREVVRLGGDVAPFVPAAVAGALRGRLGGGRT
jgi:pantetheine-phosphate adenylyltransferase